MSTSRVIPSIALAAAFFAAAGCNSVHTQPDPRTPAEVKINGAGTGVPYRLPAGFVRAKITFPSAGATGDKLLGAAIDLSPVHYADPASPLLLLPNHNPLFATHHVVNVKDGLLTSVTTDDDSKIKEALVSLAQTGINLVKLQAAGGLPTFGAQSDALPDAADIFLNDSPHPTDAEVAYAMSSALGSKLSFDLLPTETQKSWPVGTAKLVAVTTTVKPVDVPSPGYKPAVAPALPADGTFALPPDQVPGLYTRTLRPYLATVDLVLQADALRQLRLLSHQKALRALRAKERESASEDQSRADELERAKIHFNDAFAQASELRKRIAQLELELTRHDLTAELRASRAAAREDAGKFAGAQKSELDAALARMKTAEAALRQAKIARTRLLEDIARMDYRVSVYADSARSLALTGEIIPLQKDLILRTSVAVVALPDTTSLIRVPVTRTAFGKTVNTLEFKDGTLTKYDSSQPGAVAEALAIPAEVTKTIVEAVAGIFQFRIDLNAKRKSAAESEVTLATALKKMQEDLDALRNPPPAAPTQPVGEAVAPMIDGVTGLLPTRQANPGLSGGTTRVAP